MKPCPFKFKETRVIMPEGTPGTWYPKGEYDACKLQYDGFYMFEECMGENKCPIMQKAVK